MSVRYLQSCTYPQKRVGLSPLVTSLPEVLDLVELPVDGYDDDDAIAGETLVGQDRVLGGLGDEQNRSGSLAGLLQGQTRAGLEPGGASRRVAVTRADTFRATSR